MRRSPANLTLALVGLALMGCAASESIESDGGGTGGSAGRAGTTGSGGTAGTGGPGLAGTTGSACANGATRPTSATVSVEVPASGTLSTSAAGGDRSTVELTDGLYMTNLDLDQ